MLRFEPITRLGGVRLPRRTVWRSHALLAASLVGHPGVLRAAPLALELSTERTQAASDCADRNKLFGKVQRLSQRPLMTEQASQALVRVTARFDKLGDEYLAELEFSGAKPGERRFRDRGTDCASLEDAVSVAIVLLLDSEIQRREQAPIVAVRAEPTINLISGEVKVQVAEARTMSWTLSGRVGPLWGAANWTVPWFALDLGVTLREKWLFELGAFALLPQHVTYGRGEVAVSLITAEVRACRLWGSSLLFGACAVPQFGRLRGTGRGFVESATADLVWAAVGGSLLLTVPVGKRWFGGLETVVLVPLSDQTLSVANLGTAWNSAAIWGALAVRLGVRFY